MDRKEQVEKLQEFGEYDLAMALDMFPERDLLIMVEDFSFNMEAINRIELKYEKVKPGDPKLGGKDDWCLVESEPPTAPLETSDQSE